ncbi:solute carrier family 35 member G1-like [Penaeus chinensis]|uniref:solute carrier family 35 member G1-like n=1 Tax=Penaeus chinensis TaxID=139456 RepID=UPI001FB634CC|nr:solute carrier family 35 member G1-like [Penaeus chinensis]XP_047473926.1 solute carrier family 35 member G1-like [Penaeus chinensis]XP_047473927.1 solute carrier family 35 member G1-like [Penaeus chinensis]XP_047473928.1 solute carrier family 35 member G1-like [Penaeus chinensis]
MVRPNAHHHLRLHRPGAHAASAGHTTTPPDAGIELEPLVEDERSPAEAALRPERRYQVGRDTRAGRCALPHVGLFMAVLSSLFFSLCSLIVKVLADVSPMELAVFRFVGILLPTLPLLIRRGDPPFPRGRRLMLMLRGLVGATSLMLQFYAFRHMPLADASVIVFSVPVFVAVFARVFLGEPCGLFHGVVILLTLAGVILIARPPLLFGSLSDAYTTENWWGAAAAISGTVVAANVYVILRVLKGLHFSVIMTNFALVALVLTPLVSWFIGDGCVPRCGNERYLILAIGIFSFGGQILLTKALQLEQAGPVSIARTADVVFAFIWQAIFFQEFPDSLSLMGALLVTSCVFLTGLRKWVISLPETSSARRRLRCLMC